MLYSATTTTTILAAFTAKLFEAVHSAKATILVVNTDALVPVPGPGFSGLGDVDDSFMWHVLTEAIRKMRGSTTPTKPLTIFFCCGEDNRFGGGFGDQPWVQRWNASLVEASIKVSFGTVEMLADAARGASVSSLMFNFAPMTAAMIKLLEGFEITHVMGQGGIDQNRVAGYNLRGLDPTLLEGFNNATGEFSACNIRVGELTLPYLGVKTSSTAFTFPRDAQCFVVLAPIMPDGWLAAALAMPTVKLVAIPKGPFAILFAKGARNLFWGFMMKALTGAAVPERTAFRLTPHLHKIVPEGSALDAEYVLLIKRMPTLEAFYNEYVKYGDCIVDKNLRFADEDSFSPEEKAKALCLIYGRIIAPQAFGPDRYEAILRETSPFSFGVADAYGELVLPNTEPDAQTSPMYDGVAAMLLLGPILDPEFASMVGTVALNGGPAPANLVDYFDRFFAEAEAEAEGPGRLMSSV